MGLRNSYSLSPARCGRHMPIVFPQPGGCLCGSVRYQILEDPLLAYACHCTDCQTASGSAFALCLTTPISSIEVTKGEPSARTVVLEGPREWNFALCTSCATRLWSVNQNRPGVVSVNSGTLDDTSWVYPVAHIWVASALEWAPISEESLTYPGKPGDPREMIRAWRERSS
jgi:hypothetical protein